MMLTRFSIDIKSSAERCKETRQGPAVGEREGDGGRKMQRGRKKTNLSREGNQSCAEDSEATFCLGSGFSLCLNPSNLYVLYHSRQILCRNNSKDLPELPPRCNQCLLSQTFRASLIKAAGITINGRKRRRQIANEEVPSRSMQHLRIPYCWSFDVQTDLNFGCVFV